MNPDYSLADWVSYRGTLMNPDYSLADWVSYRGTLNGRRTR